MMARTPAPYSRAWYIAALKAEVVATRKKGKETHDLLRIHGRAGDLFITAVSDGETFDSEMFFTTETEARAEFSGETDRVMLGLSRRKRELLGLSEPRKIGGAK